MLKFIFKDIDKNTEHILPVTPSSFEVSHGINIETINIHTLGDVALPGYGVLPIFKVDCMFPARSYSFNQPDTDLNPYNYVKKFEAWCDNRSVLRWIISEADIEDVNIPVVVSEITYGERDGSRDVYAVISLRQYRELFIIQKNNTGNNTRSVDKPAETVPYVVEKGDTLSAICRKAYGDFSLYPKLAKYNNIKNPHLIHIGAVIKLPPKNLL